MKIVYIDHEYLIRKIAYNAVCEMYSKEIIEIQRYIPGWMPPSPTKF